jgi:hypothetical protein
MTTTTRCTAGVLMVAVLMMLGACKSAPPTPPLPEPWTPRP